MSNASYCLSERAPGRASSEEPGARQSLRSSRDGSQQLNREVGRPDSIDKDEFYPALGYLDAVDHEGRLVVPELSCIYDRPHGAHRNGTPYEAPRGSLRW